MEIESKLLNTVKTNTLSVNNNRTLPSKLEKEFENPHSQKALICLLWATAFSGILPQTSLVFLPEFARQMYLRKQYLNSNKSV